MRSSVVVEDHGGEVEGQVVGALAVDGGVVLGGLGGSRAVGVGGGLGGSSRSRGGPRLLDGQLLEERILLAAPCCTTCSQLERGELQELDGLLEQRGHDDPLALP